MLEAASLKTLLSRPLMGGWSHGLTRTWWTREHDVGLALLCKHRTPVTTAADTLARSETSLAHRARKAGLILPDDWRDLLRKRDLAATPTLKLQYPYIVEVRGEHEMLLAVNALVSRGLPDHMRADVCQEIMLAIWEKTISLDELKRSPKLIGQYVRKAKRENYEACGYALSLDVPMRGGRYWYDVLPDPTTETFQ